MFLAYSRTLIISIPNHNTLLVSSAHGFIFIYFCYFQTGEKIETTKEHTKSILDIQANAKDMMIITASKDTTAKVRTLKKLLWMPFQSYEEGWAFSPHSNFLLTMPQSLENFSPRVPVHAAWSRVGKDYMQSYDCARRCMMLFLDLRNLKDGVIDKIMNYTTSCRYFTKFTFEINNGDTHFGKVIFWEICTF